MASNTHPAAPHHLPPFVGAADGSDPFLVFTGILLLAIVIAFGVFFLWLHTLPERIAHRTHRLQFQIVAVLGLIALFTHIHAFWIAGLLLALIDLPDFAAPLRRIAGSTEKMAGMAPGTGDTTVGEPRPHEAPAAPQPMPVVTTPAPETSPATKVA